jgi:dTDP-4-dehydrorhamnose 3,5-epimerase
MGKSRLPASEPSILETTLAASTRDGATVTAEGVSLQEMIDGFASRDLTTHTDERGTVCELYDMRWNFHAAPVDFAYCFTIRPGFVKGWNLHKEHEDRYIVLQGELQLVLYDPRPESPTYGKICTTVSSEHRRRVITFPRDVWHADFNIGTKDAFVVNLPTQPYDHNSPDKYRLPIDTPLIPYKFPPEARGW